MLYVGPDGVQTLLQFVEKGKGRGRKREQEGNGTERREGDTPDF